MSINKNLKIYKDVLTFHEVDNIENILVDNKEYWNLISPKLPTHS